MPASNYMANGNIPIASFVKNDSTAATNRKVIVCGLNDLPTGIANIAARNPPLPNQSDPNYAAIAGDPVQVFQDGDPCLLKLGSSAVVAGQRLKSDASGNGIPIATSGATLQNIGAVAEVAANAGEYCQVRVRIYSEVCPS